MRALRNDSEKKNETVNLCASSEDKMKEAVHRHDGTKIGAKSMQVETEIKNRKREIKMRCARDVFAKRV